MKLGRLVFIAGVAVLTLGVAPPGRAVELLGPTPYLCFDNAAILSCNDTQDSPFSSVDFSGGYFHLETFEDGLFNTPGVSANGGPPFGPNSFRDSVDEDDGTIDGSGQNGWIWYSAGSTSVTFTFDAGVLGSLPTHAGIAWTDVGDLPGTDNVTLQAFDALDVSLGILGPALVGDGGFQGGTAEDRFFGVIHTGGISKITFTSVGHGSGGSGNWEMDHLQYGSQLLGPRVPALTPWAWSPSLRACWVLRRCVRIFLKIEPRSLCRTGKGDVA